MIHTFNRQPWYQFLDHGMRDLVDQSVFLLNREESLSADNSPLRPGSHFHDYSFVVFPISKAYEGFLKKWCYTNGYINERAYKSDHFRIGKALNPSLPRRFKDNRYVYDQIAASCSDPRLGNKLWAAWKTCRNLVFHYFPHHQHFITLDQAKAMVDQVISAIRSAALCTKDRPAG